MSKPEPLSREIAAAFESLQRAAAERAEKEAADRPTEDPPEAEKQLTTKVIQLDFWDDGKRGAPNAVFRSALFPALNNKQARRFLKGERLFSVSGIEAFFTGERFDQSDLDVYLELLNLARTFPLGTPVKFSAYGLLGYGRDTCKNQSQKRDGL